MKDLKQRYSTEINQADWMGENAIAHWAAWYCVHYYDDPEIRDLITTQFACWKYLKERRTTVEVSERMKQRATEFDAYLKLAKHNGQQEAVNAYLFPKNKRQGQR